MGSRQGGIGIRGGPVRTVALGQLLVFLAALLASAAAAHDCPRHHLRSGAAHHVTHSGGEAAESATSGEAPAEPGGTPCSCLANCHAGSTAVLPGSAPGTASAAGSIHPVFLPGPDRSPSADRPEYFLPYPLGPPSPA